MEPNFPWNMARLFLLILKNNLHHSGSYFCWDTLYIFLSVVWRHFTDRFGWIISDLEKADTLSIHFRFQENFFTCFGRKYSGFTITPISAQKVFQNFSQISLKTLPKAKGIAVPRVESSYQSSCFQVISQVLTQTFKISTKLQLRSSTKHQHQNIDKTSASQYQLNINFNLLTNLLLKVWTIFFLKELTKLQPQYLD